MARARQPSPHRRDLAGVAEAAALLGISKAVLCARRARRRCPGDVLPQFPAPVAELACGPVWERAQLEAYAGEAERRAALGWVARLFADREEATRS